jgi:hypothetical protein
MEYEKLMMKIVFPYMQNGEIIMRIKLLYMTLIDDIFLDEILLKKWFILKNMFLEIIYETRIFNFQLKISSE